MPYPNEAACRLASPAKFVSFGRIKRTSDGKEYSLIIGGKKGGGSETQSLRYPKATWTEKQARTHCASKNGTFEPALKEGQEDVGALEGIEIVDIFEAEPSWATVDRTVKGIRQKKYRSAWFYRPEEDKPSTWKLPYKYLVGGKLTVHKGALRAVAAAVAGARTGTPMKLPTYVKAAINKALKAAKIGQYAEAVGEIASAEEKKFNPSMTITQRIKQRKKDNEVQDVQWETHDMLLEIMRDDSLSIAKKKEYLGDVIDELETFLNKQVGESEKFDPSRTLLQRAGKKEKVRQISDIQYEARRMVEEIFDDASLSTKQKKQYINDVLDELETELKKLTESQVREGMQDANMEKLTIRQTLTEAKFIDAEEGTSGPGKIELVVIQKGWSKNGNYYGDEVLEQIAVGLQSNRKMYIDHSLGGSRVRSMQDWAATIEASQREGGEVIAVAEFTDNPKSAWLYGEAKRHPEEVEASIDIDAEVKPGKVDGKEGQIINSMVKMHSTDFVSAASAGGRARRVVASVMERMQEEYLDSLLLRQVEKLTSEEDMILNTFKEFLREAVEAVREDKPETVEAAWRSFEERCRMHITEQMKIGGGETIMLKQEKLLEMLKAVFGKIEAKEYDEAQTSLQAILDSAAEGTGEDLSAVKVLQGQVAKTQKDLTDVTKAKEDLETKVKASEAELATAKDELQKSTDKLNQLTQDKVLEDRKILIAAKLKEAGIPEDKITDVLREDLMKLEKDEDIQSRIDALKKLAHVGEGKVQGMGAEQLAEQKRLKEEEKKKQEISDEEAVELFG